MICECAFDTGTGQWFRKPEVPSWWQKRPGWAGRQPVDPKP